MIDDGYDAVPKASDLEGQEIWANFFADAAPTEVLLTEIFPAYLEIQPEQLRSSDEFVTALWGAKEQAPADSGILSLRATAKRSKPTRILMNSKSAWQVRVWQ